jgi:hypothetical protein
MNDATLVEEFKALLLARRREDPLVVAMSEDVKRIRTVIKGQAESVNFSLGNSREAVERVNELSADASALREVVMVQADTITGLQNELIAVRKDLATALDRIENMAQWAKTKGKT